MIMNRRNFVLCVIILWAAFARKRIASIVSKLRRGAQLLRDLPGPGKELESGIFGHMTGPLMLKPGEVLCPELIVEHSVERFCEVGKQYRGQGLFRSKSVFSHWTHR